MATKKMKELGVSINDLWKISESLPLEAHSDDVHFDTIEGRRALGMAVIRSIEACGFEDNILENLF